MSDTVEDIEDYYDDDALTKLVNEAYTDLLNKQAELQTEICTQEFGDVPCKETLQGYFQVRAHSINIHYRVSGNRPYLSKPARDYKEEIEGQKKTWKAWRELKGLPTFIEGSVILRVRFLFKKDYERDTDNYLKPFQDLIKTLSEKEMKKKINLDYIALMENDCNVELIDAGKVLADVDGIVWRLEPCERIDRRTPTKRKRRT